MKKQSGVVLIVSLIFLVILTLVGVTAMNVTSLEERMSANFKDQQLAFQAAEAALKEAEDWLDENAFSTSNFYANTSCATSTTSKCFSTTCTNGLCSLGTFSATQACLVGTAEPWKGTASTDIKPWTTTGRSRTATEVPTGVATAAKFIIEFRCYALRDPETPAPAGTSPPSAYHAPLFRITTLATGGSDSARIMLQTTFKKL